MPKLLLDGEYSAKGTIDEVIEGSLEFITPSIISWDNLERFMKIDTVMFDEMYAFTCAGERYLWMVDEMYASEKDLKDTIRGVVALDAVHGKACVPKDMPEGEIYIYHGDFDLAGGSAYLWHWGEAPINVTMGTLLYA